MDLNSVTLVGRVAYDPQYSPATSTSDARLAFVLAVNRPKSENCDFVPISVWGQYAQTMYKFVTQGKEAAVKGRLRVNVDTDRDGNRRRYMEVRADEINLGRDSAKVWSEKQNGSFQQPLPQGPARRAEVLNQQTAETGTEAAEADPADPAALQKALQGLLGLLNRNQAA